MQLSYCFFGELFKKEINALFINKNYVKNNEVKRFGRFFFRFFKVVTMVPELLGHHTKNVKPGKQGFLSQ